MTLGVDEPDARGRTGLHLTGLDLDGNPDVRVRAVTLLSSNWYVLRTTELDYRAAERHLDDPAPRDLRPRKRRDRPALRPRPAHGAADAAVPVHRLRERAPGRHAARGRRGPAR